MPSAAQPVEYVTTIEAHTSSPIVFDDMLSWNTTPTSSLGAASPTDGSQRNSAVGIFPSDTKACPSLPSMAQMASSGTAEESTTPSHHRDSYVPLRDVPSPLPSPTGSCVLAHTLPPSPEPKNRSADHFVSSSTGKRSMRSDSEDEVVGVTADGELLFRLRDGSVGRRHSSAGNGSGAVDGSTAHMPIRPTPHRSLPMPSNERNGLSRPPSTTEAEGVVTPPEVRSLFTNNATMRPPPAAPHRQTSVVAHLSAEDLRFAQLALRLRDRENDVYTEHVQEELRRWDAVCVMREQHELRERFVKTAWDLRRF